VAEICAYLGVLKCPGTVPSEDERKRLGIDSEIQVQVGKLFVLVCVSDLVNVRSAIDPNLITFLPLSSRLSNLMRVKTSTTRLPQTLVERIGDSTG
jgi:hypothetical protein